MKKLMMIGFLMMFLALVQSAQAQPYCVEFIAGQHYDVGDVCVERVGDNLEIQIIIDDPAMWPLNESHVHIAPTLGGIPQKNGNPIPGQFQWSADGTGLAIVPLAGELPGEKPKDPPVPYDYTEVAPLFIAVHGVVGICDCETLLELLPEEVEAEIVYPGDSSYFIVTITGDGILDGVHKGWCADADDLIEGDELHLGQIYSTICEDIENIPEDAIVYDSNLPAVNWLLNNWEDLGYTAGDAQAAIWILLSGHLPDDTSSIEEGGDWPADQAFDPEDAEELAELAEENNEFWPACGEVMAVVFIPPVWETGPRTGQPRQSVLIEIPAPCCETAWAGIDLGEDYGLEFPGSNWALYFLFPPAVD